MQTESRQSGETRKDNQNKDGIRHPHRKRRLWFWGILLALFLGAAVFLLTTRLTQVTVTGSTRYTAEEIISMVFKRDRDYNTLYALYRDRFEAHEDIPFIEKYSVKVTGLHSAEITVYEKSLAGCIEYMGTYMYFDKDGIIVESSGERDPAVLLVTGLKFQNIVMYEKLTVEDDSVFSEILNISQLISGHDLSVDRMNFDSQNNVTLYVENIRVYLGASQYMAEKVAELNDMLPQLLGLSGTLYLNEYTPEEKNPSYTFIQDQS